MNFIWSKKKIVPSNDFSWANDLRSFDSNNQEVDLSKLEQPPEIKIYDEKDQLIDTKKAEYPEQCLSHNFIDSSACVLELGARYGSVSCVINKKLDDKNKQVSVEPDSSVWDALFSNVIRNNCSIHLHKGFVSEKSRGLTPFGYAAFSYVDDESSAISTNIETLELIHDIKFDTLVADCEGFLEEFFDEYPHLYEQLHTVIFEADFPNKCNYEKIRNNLKLNGFREIIHGFQNVYKK